MKAHLYALTADGQSVPVIVDAFGNISGGGSGGTGGSSASTDSGGWSYVAATNGITNTSDVTLSAAPGSGKCVYLSAIQVFNASTTTSTEVVIKSGSTVLHRGWAGAEFGYSFEFPRPLVAALNTAMTAACITTGTVTYINAQGFIAGAPNQSSITQSQQIEITDFNGELVTTNAGDVIALAA